MFCIITELVFFSQLLYIEKGTIFLKLDRMHGWLVWQCCLTTLSNVGLFEKNKKYCAILITSNCFISKRGSVYKHDRVSQQRWNVYQKYHTINIICPRSVSRVVTQRTDFKLRYHFLTTESDKKHWASEYFTSYNNYFVTRLLRFSWLLLEIKQFFVVSQSRISV